MNDTFRYRLLDIAYLPDTWRPGPSINSAPSFMSRRSEKGPPKDMVRLVDDMDWTKRGCGYDPKVACICASEKAPVSPGPTPTTTVSPLTTVKK